MTDLQNTEYEMLRVFTDLCERLKLRFFAVCGTALGAAKYGGFIPWDDDIDVAMPREDYELFIQKAPEYLPKELFLQNYISDPHMPILYSKLRNSQTTYIEKSSAKLDINHGVYIDIFPLDGYPDSKFESKIFEFKKRVFNSQLSCFFDIERNKKSKLLMSVWKLFGLHRRTNRTIRKYTKMISKYNILESKLICNHGNWQGKLEYAPREQYGVGVYAKFEGLRIRIPERYNEYLTQKYGDWRAELPPEQQVGHHYYEICDLDKPYTHYMKKKNK